jgi:AraC family transcriptional regulator, transcriptional activator of pobA
MAPDLLRCDDVPVPMPSLDVDPPRMDGSSVEDMGLSSAPLQTTDTGRRAATGAPVYGYRRVPGVPPVGVVRMRPEWPHTAGFTRPFPHAHDFLVLVHVEQGSGTVRVDGRTWTLAAGDVFVIAPGEVVDPGDTGEPDTVLASAVSFPADVIETAAPGTFLSWRVHPLLFPFVRGVGGGAQRLHVPPAGRPAFAARVAALEQELNERRDGYNEAVLAHLTLLLVAVSRLAADVPRDLAVRDEPLLAAVFDAIEAGFREPISLRDIAAAVGLTPGHLTTVVGRRTGRTVQQWLTERRMTEARRLLATTDLTIEAVAQRAGYRDPGYFTKRFRHSHGVAPLEWRRAGRAEDPSARSGAVTTHRNR